MSNTLYGLAWVVVVLSLFAPGADVGGFHFPVALIALAVLQDLQHAQPLDLSVPLAEIGFALSPLIFAAGPRNHWKWLWRAPAVVLLGVWAPVLSSALNPAPGSWIDANLGWGYYVFAAAHTAAFVACVMGAAVATQPSRARGFEVITNGESAPSEDHAVSPSVRPPWSE